MHPKEIVTPRLRLLTSTPARLRADFSRDRAFSSLLGAIVPEAWPPEHWEPHCLAFFETMRAQYPETSNWNRYVVLRSDPATLIGTVGAFKRSAREAEIGYSVLPFWQRQGYATEAARALLGELLLEPTVTCVSAQTFPHLTGSVAVMLRCGMAPAGEGDEPGTVRYRLGHHTTAPDVPGPD